MKTQFRLASTQPDQSLRCPENKAWVLNYPLSAQRRPKPPSLIRVFTGRTRLSVGFVILRLICSAGTTTLNISREMNLVTKSDEVKITMRNSQQLLALWIKIKVQGWKITCLAFQNVLLIHSSVLEIFKLEPRHEKTSLCHMLTTKMQVILPMRTVWSVPLLFAL